MVAERERESCTVTMAAPKKLMYQFNQDFKLKVSDRCCVEFKEKPLIEWQKQHKKPIKIIGLMREEGGRRNKVNCILYKRGKIKAFMPLAKVTKDWEEWFIKEHKIKLCELYYEPYNFERTGCKGCPYNIHIQDELDILKEKLPSEYKQCEYLWKPVYDEYRRINYRLKGEEQTKLF